MSKKNYVILGATGHIGHVLAAKLLAKGHQVLALGRDEKKLEVLSRLRAQTASPSYGDAVALTQAFRGKDGAFALVPPSYGEEDFGAFQDRTGEAIAKAAADSGLKHLISLSSIGAELPQGTGPIAGLHRQEQRLNKIPGLNVLHLRPSSFMENQFWSIPVIKSMGVNGSASPGNYPLPLVATQDIGEKAAELLDGLSFSGHSFFDFTGPREATMEEFTSALGKAIGKPDLKYVQFSLEDARKGMVGSGMKPAMADMMIEMYKAGNEGKLHPNQELTADHRGKTTLDEFARVFSAVYGQG